MRLIQYNSVFIFKLQIGVVPFKIVPLGGYTSLETLLTHTHTQKLLHKKKKTALKLAW